MRSYRLIFAIRFCFLFLCLSSGISHAEAQSITERIAQRADSLIAAGDTLQGIQELNRFAFYTEDYAAVPRLKLRIGNLYENAGDWKAARKAYADAAGYLLLDSVYYESLFRSGMMSFLMEEYAQSVSDLGYAFRQDAFPAIRSKSAEMLLCAENFNHQWEDAESLAMEVFSADTAFKRQLKIEYAAAKRFRPRKERTASTLNLIFPGAGLLYAGKPAHALVSLLLNGAAAAGTAWAIVDGRYLLGALSGFALFQKFWMGGERFARQSVKEFNAKKNLAFAKRITLLQMANMRK